MTKTPDNKTRAEKAAVNSAVAFVGDWLDYWFPRANIPGLSLAIRHKDNLVLEKAWGYADLEKKEKLTPQHIFRAASHSKMFAATAIMLLQEQGRLKLDDRAEKYLPWLQGKKAGRATIRQILNHKAGLFRDGDDSSYWNLERDFPPVDELRGKIAAMKPLSYKPSGVKYSNWGYGLIGQIIEQVGGKPYSRFVDENIIKPLQLSHTTTDVPQISGGELANSYGDPVDGARPVFPAAIPTRALEAATGLCSTPSDLARFVYKQSLMKGGILAPQSRRALSGDFRQVAGQEGVRYGLGLERERAGNHVLTGHCGGFPGQSTATFCDAANGLSVSVCVNADNGPAWSLAVGILKSLQFHLDNRLPAPGSKKAELNGMYQNLRGCFNVFAVGDKLLLLSPGENDPWEDPYRFSKIGRERYRIKGTGGFSSDGEEVSFSRRDGKPVLKYAGEPYLKV